MRRMRGVAEWCEDELERRDGVAGWPFGGGLAMADEERSFDMLAQEVEDLIERQPQFAFLKPCRQLEKHYANKRAERSKGVSKEAGSSSSCSSSSSSTIRELLSCDGIELNGFVEEKAMTKEYQGERRRRGQHFHRNSGEKIWRISSTRCSIHEREAHIDLVNPAAAQFLMEMSPSAHTPVAVPFKWEDAPGRAKAHAEATTNPTLQLPPRLAVPSSQRNSTSTVALSRQLVMSHPLAGLFPCIGATSPTPSPPPQQQQQDEIKWMQYRASKSYGGVHRKAQNKSFSQPLAATEPPGLKPRRLFSSELAQSDPSTSSRSISHQSSSSRTTTYLSCELDESTTGSKSSSTASCESIGEDFDHDDRSPHHRRSQPGLLKLCTSHGNCLRKSKSRRRMTCSNPEVWAPTLATYFQHLDVNDEPLLEKQGAAPTSSGYLNSKGEPQALHVSSCSSPEVVSPKRPTRLPYKMPSVAEQEQSRCKRRRSNVHRSALSMDLQCPSPAYAAALEMLSPAAVTLMTSRRHRGASLPSPRPHRRVQFILSMCKTLKRVLFRQQARRSVIGTRLMYHDERAPTTFQFSKPN